MLDIAMMMLKLGSATRRNATLTRSTNSIPGELCSLFVGSGEVQVQRLPKLTFQLLLLLELLHVFAKISQRIPISEENIEHFRLSVLLAAGGNDEGAFFLLDKYVCTVPLAAIANLSRKH